MRPEMFQYVHEGHQGKERCLLRARNTVFWPKMIREVYHMPGTWKVTTNHKYYSGTASFPVAHIGDRYVLLEKNGLSNSSRCLLKILHVRKLPNSTSAAICAELSMIVTELGLSHIIRSDNGLCYNSKEFQQFLQQDNITHQTSSPNHPRSNKFVERMVRVAKKLMDKAGKEGKPWISGLYDYRVTPQSGSIASPLQLLTQCTPREKMLPQLPSTLGLGALEMYQT